MFKWWQAKDVALIVVPSILMFMGKSDMCHVQCTVGELKQHCPNKKLRNINYGHRDEPLCATVHCLRVTVGPNWKNLPEIGLKKLSNWLVILILIWSNWKEWKRKLGESIETCKEKFVKSHQVNLFLARFSQLEPQCAVAPRHQWGAAHQSLIH